MKSLGRLAFVSAILALFNCTAFVIQCDAFDQDDFKEAKEQAEKGDPEAELALGMMYDSGQGVPQNYSAALNWYRRAAAHGNPTAQNNLGIMYLKGQGVPPNPLEAAKWVRLAAAQGHPKGQLNLGFLYADGNGVARNFSEALFWFHKAAQQGDAEAERNLGNVYSEGKLARPNYIEAYKWFSLAAAQGDADATRARDRLAEKMPAAAVAEGQRLAAAFVPKRDPARTNSLKASGTGFFVTTNGHLVTAYHVVEDAARVVVRTKHGAFAAQVVKEDRTNDLALLKITGVFPRAAMTNQALLLGSASSLLKVAGAFHPLPVADSGGVKLGDSVSTLGFPNIRSQGAEPKFTRGEVNSLAGMKDDPRRFQISAPVQPGNSGGPLFDRGGNVIGVVQLRLNDLTQLLTTGSVPQNVNYALKSSYLLGFLKSVPGVNSTGAHINDEKGQAFDWVSDAQTAIAVILVF